MFARRLIGFGLGLGLGLLPVLTPALAQVSGNAAGSKSNWMFHVQEDPKQCWVVAPPEQGKSTATRDGRPVAVNRGDIYLFVSFWPKDANGGGMGEVSFTGGYDFAEGQPVVLEIGDAKFDLFAEGNMAWAASPEEDRRIAQAMKAGVAAVVTGKSQRSGTTTKDSFSLIGFTAAYEDAEKRCAK